MRGRGWLWAGLALLAACGGGADGAPRGGGAGGAGGEDPSVWSYRRFVPYRDGAGALMLLDARTGRTWYRAADTAVVWRPFLVLPPDTAHNYSPLRGLRRGTARADRDDDGGAILLRFEIHHERTLPLLLDRRSGRTWLREMRPDGPWWVPVQVLPADTSGNFAPLQSARAATPGG